MERAQYTKLEQLPNIGPAIAGELRRIGIAVPHDLVGRDPYGMYDDLCRVGYAYEQATSWHTARPPLLTD